MNTAFWYASTLIFIYFFWQRSFLSFLSLSVCFRMSLQWWFFVVRWWMVVSLCYYIFKYARYCAEFYLWVSHIWFDVRLSKRVSFFLVLCLFYLDYIQRWSWFGHLISIILSKERKTHIYQATATCIRMIRIYEDAIIYVYTYSGDSQIRGKHKNWMKTPQFMNGTKSRIASFCLPCSNQAFVWCVHFLLNNR